MIKIREAIKQMIRISEEELDSFLSQTSIKTFKRKSLLGRPGIIPDKIFFINQGIIRVFITDNQGNEHTTHFALENQFISDYSNFMLRQNGFYTLEALEETEVVILPRSAIEWGYQNLNEGQKIGRLIAEFYFIYQDNRIKNN
ncbi:MAG: cyclic nucleotide-binding domain-containing protein, partial [Bernardetiaceae bacterium]|nr:cyclic nucleotide-binding domain-containing protein [Bernardetiaceae bacterium]